MTTKKQIPTINKVQSMIDEKISTDIVKKSEIIDLVYPINSIFMTIDSTNPMKTLFPNTEWIEYNSNTDMYMWKRTK